MTREFKQHDDMEPNDLVRHLDRPPSHEFHYEHETLEVEGHTMAYVDAGKRDAEHAVVFVHGAPESSYIWRNIMPYVEHQARVIAPDHIGHGLSDKPKITYSIETFYKFFEGLLEKLELQNIILVTQDWGSVVGPLYGANHPEKVSGVVLIEALVMPNYPITDPQSAERDPTMTVAMTHYREWRSEEAISGNYEQNWFVERDLMKHTIIKPSQRVMNAFRDPFRDPAHRDPVIAWPREVGLGGDRPFPDEAMRKINAWLTNNDELRVLDLFGSPGAVSTQLEVAWRAERIIHHESAYMGLANHFAQEDRPDHIGHAIGDWFRRNFAADPTQWYLESPRNEMETVLHFATAVAAGRMEEAMTMVHPDCRWNYAGPPDHAFTGEFRGRDGVRAFLEAFGARFEIVDFTPELTWDADTIMLRVKEISRARSTGREAEIGVVQSYKVRFGQIIEFREVSDTATLLSLLADEGGEVAE